MSERQRGIRLGFAIASLMIGASALLDAYLPPDARMPMWTPLASIAVYVFLDELEWYVKRRSQSRNATMTAPTSPKTGT